MELLTLNDLDEWHFGSDNDSDRNSDTQIVTRSTLGHTRIVTDRNHRNLETISGTRKLRKIFARPKLGVRTGSKKIGLKKIGVRIVQNMIGP